MSLLATRCPECGSVFRIVEDQLKVSDGWVRCGHCSQVFNAREHLGTLEEPPAASAFDADAAPHTDEPAAQPPAPAAPAARWEPPAAYVPPPVAPPPPAPAWPAAGASVPEPSAAPRTPPRTEDEPALLLNDFAPSTSFLITQLPDLDVGDSRRAPTWDLDDLASPLPPTAAPLSPAEPAWPGVMPPEPAAVALAEAPPAPAHPASPPAVPTGVVPLPAQEAPPDAPPVAPHLSTSGNLAPSGPGEADGLAALPIFDEIPAPAIPAPAPAPAVAPPTPPAVPPGALWLTPSDDAQAQAPLASAAPAQPDILVDTVPPPLPTEPRASAPAAPAAPAARPGPHPVWAATTVDDGADTTWLSTLQAPLEPGQAAKLGLGGTTQFPDTMAVEGWAHTIALPPEITPPPLPQVGLLITEPGLGTSARPAATPSRGEANAPAAAKPSSDASTQPVMQTVVLPPAAAPAEPAEAAPHDAGPTTLPGFVKQAERERRWRRPLVRLGLILATLAALAVLVAQLVVQYRNELTVEMPALRPWVAQLCEPLGCTLSAPLALDQVVLLNSQISQTTTRGVLHLEAELRNRARYPVRTPAMELTLTDVQGQVLVRKVLPAPQLHAEGDTLQASENSPIDLYLNIGDLPVSGFSVELFYP